MRYRIGEAKTFWIHLDSRSDRRTNGQETINQGWGQVTLYKLRL
jgi:hypothetical protein